MFMLFIWASVSEQVWIFCLAVNQSIFRKKNGKLFQKFSLNYVHLPLHMKLSVTYL